MSYKIMLVDDESKIVILLKDYLERENFTVITAGDGQTALEYFFEQGDTIDLVLLDIMMPEVDGWTVCREIRKTSNVPIIMLTARSEDYDEVHGFEIGANDYVTKPVKPAALMARIHARLNTYEQPLTAQIITAGDIVINKESHIVTLKGEQTPLSPKEFELLQMLIDNRGKVVSRETLLSQVWGYEYLGGLRTVDTHINRLRLKLHHEGGRVTTVRGYGYRFE